LSKSPAAPGFFFVPHCATFRAARQFSWRLNFYLMRFCRTQDVFVQESPQACRNIDGRDRF
jgi:hypothetical protein